MNCYCCIKKTKFFRPWGKEEGRREGEWVETTWGVRDFSPGGQGFYAKEGSIKGKKVDKKSAVMADF